MATFTPDTSNEFFQLAVQLVNQTNTTVFLTGKAGTGKTTFLKHIRANCPKQMAILAPTGVAAINAGGVTLHSFFQLALAPFIPEHKSAGIGSGNPEIADKHSLLSRLRYNTEKKKIIQQLELLIIDEVSMVRCDMLDAIDTVLKYVRHRPAEAFGGVQLLFIGDLFQLPPVVREEDWKLLAGYYNSPYFFDSHVLRDAPPICIEFNKIYRQKDEQFIEILNQVRNNKVTDAGIALLESRFKPVFRRTKQDGYIVLTTHNNKATDINNRELAELPAPVFRYEAETEGDFSERAYPAEEVLYLKEGAQVMFIRNDTAEKGKRFFNGKIGTVTRLETDKIVVTCQDEDSGIEVQPEKWENIRYTVNNSTRKLESEVLGSFTQYPLRLAWAITIHKSQGLTFEKAIIDAGEAFSPGQVYVALSRCTSLEGMVLQSRIQRSSIANDPRIIQFVQRNAAPDEVRTALEEGSRKYHQSLLLSVFDYSKEAETARDLENYLKEHRESFNGEAPEWINGLLTRLTALKDVGLKFTSQLNKCFADYPVMEQSQFLQQRIPAAAGYFLQETGFLSEEIRRSPVITDSKLHSRQFNELARELFAGISEKWFLSGTLKEGYNPIAFQEKRAEFVIPSVSVNAYAGASGYQQESPHPLLQQQLRKLRDSICARTNQPVYLVAGSKTLDELARFLPHTPEELGAITGFGPVRIENYGQQFLDKIIAYCSEKGLRSLIHEKEGGQKTRSKSPVKKAAGETYQETLRLYREGKTLNEIAAVRKLARSTIEGHFAKLAGKGALDAKELLGPGKYTLIANALTAKKENQSLTAIQEELGDTVSFGDIRIVVAALAQHNETPLTPDT